MTRTGEAILKAKQEATYPLRFCTVRCGVNPQRHEGHPPRLRHPALQPLFQSVSSRIGVYRHVVTLVANQLVITDTTRAACGWKTFYDRTWSAVEAVAAGKPTSNELHAAVADVLVTTPINLPEKVLFDLRQQETAQLETHTIEHLETFPDRLLHVMRVRIAEAMPRLKWSAIEALGKRAATYALSCPTHLATAESAISGDGADATLVIAREERASMGDLVAASRGDKPFLKQFTKKTIYLLLPHLIRWSKWSEQWLDARCLASTDEGGDEIAAEDDAPVEAPRLWRRSRLAKPCSALPIAQLKAAMVLYCCTEVETLLKNAQQTIRRKRGRDESNVVADDMWTTSAADKADFASAIFNLDSFKGRRGCEMLADGTTAHKWRIASFRTDGVALAVTFVSGRAPAAFNADNLMQRGYQLAAPGTPVDPTTARRGLYFVGETRCDVAPTVAVVRATVVDPGFCKPVHVATVRTDSAVPFDDTEHWHVTEAEWMRDSGRARAHASERCRRDGTEYGRALESLRGTGRRKSATTTFVEYAGAMLRTLAVRAAELTSVARSAARWQQKRCLARFIGRLCDRLFDRTSTRPKKNQLPSQHQPSMTASEREELRRRLMEVRRQRREAPTVVFFGDASYGPSMRGHNAIPKKGLLRELCHRGLTFLLDEYKTSKMCPCGHDELKTTGYRFRAHKSDGAALCDRRSLSLF